MTAQPGHKVTLKLNQQQIELIERTIARGAAPDIQGLVREILERAMAEALLDFVMEPGTGRAIELRKGQVLRIEQIKGGQCVDFNCFNLHDYREFMHTGRTRTEHGINPGPGDFMWSAPPRERPMIYILADTVHCNDVMYPRCSPFLFENSFGFHTHTNCHDIQSEAQREYGLTPDDVTQPASCSSSDNAAIAAITSNCSR